MATEFTICLVCDEKSAAVINELRSKLAPSPYRDDAPHVTLLRVSSSSSMTDDRLASNLKKVLVLAPEISATARLKTVINVPGRRYGTSSVALISLDAETKAWRKSLIARLKEAGYHISPHQNIVYVPHVTVRLGVPIRGEALRATKKRLKAEQILTFDRLMLLRIEKRDRARRVREVRLDAGGTNTPL
jgi:2'-5' RNA ligase